MGAPIRSFLRLPLAQEYTQTIRIRRSGRGGERRNGAPGSNRRGEKKPLRKRRKTRKNAPENVPLPRMEVLLLPLFRRAAGGASARPARAQSCIARRIYSLRTSTCGIRNGFSGAFLGGEKLGAGEGFASLSTLFPFFVQYQRISKTCSDPLSRRPSPPLPQADARLCVVRVAPKGRGRRVSTPAGPVAVAARSSTQPNVARCIFELLPLRCPCSRQRQLREERIHSLFSPATSSDRLK